MRSLRWSLIQYNRRPYKKGIWTQTHTLRENATGRWRGRDGVMLPKQRSAKDGQQIPDTRGEGCSRLSLTSSEGTHSAGSLIADFQPPKLGDNTFLCLSLPVCGSWLHSPGGLTRLVEAELWYQFDGRKGRVWRVNSFSIENLRQKNQVSSISMRSRNSDVNGRRNSWHVSCWPLRSVEKQEEGGLQVPSLTS